ncbi:MAG: hypothetical protein WCJ09_21170 [Planctomycetota bacterium]
MLTLNSGAEETAWKSDLENLGLIVLDLSEDRRLVVDAVHPWNAAVVAERQPDVAAVIHAGRHPDRMPVHRCQIDYVGPWPPSEQAMRSINLVAESYGPRRTSLNVYFTNPEVDLVGGLTQFAGQTNRCAAIFVGKIPELSEGDISSLIRRGASVRYASGYPIGSNTDIQAIRLMSERGLRIPIVFYLHRGNMGTALDDAQQMLDITYQGGVSFVPATSHPQFNPSNGLELPSGVEFSEFLVKAYRQFPHFDDVFEPITSFTERLSKGVWSPEFNHYLPVRYRIDEDGLTHQYRCLPWRGVQSHIPPSSEQAPVASLSSACAKCRWFKTCGGCDATAETIFDLHCHHNMLFLEFFTRQMHENLCYSKQDG